MVELQQVTHKQVEEMETLVDIVRQKETVVDKIIQQLLEEVEEVEEMVVDNPHLTYLDH